MRLANMMALLSLFTGAVNAADLTIKVTGVNSGNGYIVIAVDDDLDNFAAFKGDVAAIRYRAVSGESSVTFSDVPEGYYVISILHDENDNRRLDMEGEEPVEGYGFSRARQTYCQAELSNAAINVRKPATTTTVMMLYRNDDDGYGCGF